MSLVKPIISQENTEGSRPGEMLIPGTVGKEDRLVLICSTK